MRRRVPARRDNALRGSSCTSTHAVHDVRRVVAPRLLRRRPCLRPYLVERVAVVEPAVLHHVPYRVRVADVLERIAVQHEQVGELATLQCAEVAAETDRLGTEDRCGAQYIVLAHAAALHRPHLPVIAETLELAMAAHGRTTATLDQ